ncbi:N-6 DNA methylase [Chryseobacterium sp. AG363]|uniref:N-6 DNA methylase n=1 Tax=Chryseobacterium sp. AG363 TaxID=2183997 RepID=UPI000E7478B5|nr:N-6 DNA methylase [Chryseobacterium sp. AG363]RKE81621.1 type I restriction-modification system DNA methylase subunit [Chryseobacterium sp. AG363]
MIDKENLKKVLKKIGFIEKSKYVLEKFFPDVDAYLKVDFKQEKIYYPLDKGLILSGDFITTFANKENFVVLECVSRLFTKGYKPQHIELEPRWIVGHGASGGRADIMIKDNSEKSLIIIECKTPGKEFDDEWKKTLINGGQLLSYAKQAGSTQFVALYTSDFIDDEIIHPNYYLLTLKDNVKLLEELSSEDQQPLTYSEAKLLDKEDIFKAWKNTYSQDYATKGLFEDDIPAYEIGKKKYSIADLDKISSKDIQGKYHQFATILRQHNVSGRENAFDKLVNLFLCKIVDETNNPEELKFYWKGIAYDSPFELVDRLQRLYQEGMQRFLGEDVVYVSNNQIEDAFRFFKKDPDATQETIKKFFKELKFYNNNDFGFIDVHNEKLFHQNTKVLIALIKMLQDIKLKSDDEEHQFLGDMFEGFLDQGVKQSEGQFFTPMPIVKFILKSLPLEEIIIEGDSIPKVIDYACGAGHFLNEYAQEIKPIIKDIKDAEISNYFSQILGIEKEYRLSKVSKVSAFMYGQDEINIVYADALGNVPSVKEKDFSILIANPPYSVKGFLETLSESDRKKFQLIKTVGEKSFPNNNSIEAFFIERAKQILKPDGVAGIIVPASILTKGKTKSTSKSTNIFVATREILLKYFDIIAIAEFGKGTFGKTGTNTVTLFIRRKKEEPAPADHFKNRIDSWFKSDETKDDIFEDEHLLKHYCIHLEISLKHYKTLLNGSPSSELLESELFLEYFKEFNNWAEIKNRKKQSTFKSLSKDEQELELKLRFVKYLQECEKDKLYYFVLAYQNPQKVLIVKSPSKITEMKEFLGYEWSSAKGKEGIKYISDFVLEDIIGENIEENEDGDVLLEEDDVRVLSNIYNLNNINTPLYDPQDNENSEKINFLIAQNFGKAEIAIPEALKNFVSISSLYEMIDFRKINFNKSITLTPSTTYNFETKWHLVKLSSIATINPSKTEIRDISDITPISFVDMAAVSDRGFISKIEKKEYKEIKNGSYTYFQNGDILIAKITPCMENGKCALAINLPTKIGFGSTEFHVIRCNNPEQSKYIFALLNNPYIRKVAEQNMTGSSGHRRVPEDFYSNLKIPVMPDEIEKKLIKEFTKIDKEFSEAVQSIDREQEKLEALYNEAYLKADKIYKISDTDYFAISIGKRVLKKELNRDGLGIPVYSANVFQQFGFINKQLLDDFSSPSVIWGIDGDWMVNCLPANYKFYPTDHCGVIRIKKDDVHPKYLAWVLKVEGERLRFSRANRASMDSISTISIKAPSKSIQKKLIEEVEKIENKISIAQALIETVDLKKQEIINRFL